MQRSTRLFTPVSWCLVLLLLVPVAISAVPVASAAETSPPEGGDEQRVRTERRVVVVSPEAGPHREMMFQPLSSAYLGVELSRLTPELRIHFGVPDDRGVLVARVEEGSPASEAGLAVGDIVTTIDGEVVESPWDLGVTVRRHSGGDAVDLEVWRDGRPLDFTATLAERERKRIEVGRLLEEGELEALDDLPPVRWLERGDGAGGEDGAATVWVDPGMAEDLGETLHEIRLPVLAGPLRERNRELEKRLKTLEQRLRDLERRLDQAPPER